MHSLRARLFAGTTLASAGIMAVLAAALDLSVRHTLVAEFDATLTATANSVASMVEQGYDGLHFDPDAVLIPEFQPGRHAAYFEIWGQDVVIARSPSLGKTNLVGSPKEASAEAPQIGRPRIVPAMLPDGRPGRRVSIKFHPAQEPFEADGTRPVPAPATATLMVAFSTHELEETLEHLRWMTIGLCAGATLLAGAALLVVVSRATRPMRALADQIGQRSATDLSALAAAKALPDELVPVVQRLNDLLARLDAAFNRERAFTAEVAHELRTPLAGLLATLEVCRSRPREASAYETAIDKSLGMLTQMQSLVENLLLLARAERGQLTLHTEDVDLASLAAGCWALFESRAAGRGLAVELCLPPTCFVRCDREFLRIVLHNLFDNAVSYTNPGGRIVVAFEQSATGAAVVVSNTGSALTPDDLGRLFQRFWRKESARSETGLHAGLGLSLARRLMLLQGGDLQVVLAATAADEFQIRAILCR